MFKRKIALFTAALLSAGALLACGNSTSRSVADAAHEKNWEGTEPESVLSTEADTVDTSAGAEDEDAGAPVSRGGSEDQVYHLGDTWTVDGLWTLTITGIHETDERNEYSEKNPEAVYVVDYIYTNEGYEDSMDEGLYIYLDDQVVDAAGEMAYWYPGDTTYIPYSIPVGAGCFANTSIGADHAGKLTIIVNMYTPDFERCSATFEIDPEDEAVDVDIEPSGVDTSKALRIGDTWTVDGLWEVTITGVHESEERTEFSPYTPEAAYIVDYTYKNLGYESEYSDGLYISLADVIIDSADMTGYEYYANLTDYPQSVPVGATCKAQVCVGVDHAGSFCLVTEQYGGDDEDIKLEKQMFYIDVK